MMKIDDLIQEISDVDDRSVIYSFCTLVTNLVEYKEMVAAFVAKGFCQQDCEFLYLDNSKQNQFEAFSGYNRFLRTARGRYIILCHQDILPIQDDRGRLDALLTELDRYDPHWGLCGNAGAKTDGTLALRISDPNTTTSFDEGGPFPAKVMSLDENFIIARREANLALSHDLSGFHWYGSDLCIIADILGWTSYVIDFHLSHKSGGNPDATFTALGKRLGTKYARAFRSRWQHVTTRRPVVISGSPTATVVAKLLRKARLRLGI